MLAIVVFQNKTTRTRLPATIPLDPSRAKGGAKLLESLSFGDARRSLQSAGVITESGHFNEHNFLALFRGMCYVAIGLAETPTCHRGYQGMLCTCVSFCLHAQCEHVYFAQGMNIPGHPSGRTFNRTPVQRKRGRPKGRAKPKAKRKRGRPKKTAQSVPSTQMTHGPSSNATINHPDGSAHVSSQTVEN